MNKLILAFLLCAPAIAAADTVDVDVDGTSVTLTLGSRGCASAELSDAALHHEIKVCRAEDDHLEFEVKRWKQTKDGHTKQHVRVTSKLASGKRAVIAKLDATEVGATLR